MEKFLFAELFLLRKKVDIRDGLCYINGHI